MCWEKNIPCKKDMNCHGLDVRGSEKLGGVSGVGSKKVYEMAREETGSSGQDKTSGTKGRH